MAEKASGEPSAEAETRPAAWARAVLAKGKPLGWFPYLMLGLGIALSLIAWRSSSNVIEGQIAAELKDRVGLAKSTFDRHVLDYVNAAHKLQGALEVSGSITRQDFARYVQSSELTDTFPGFQSLQFVRYVPGAARDRFLAEVRDDRSIQPEGYPNFAIKPEGDRPEYLVVDFVEPLQGNAGVFGMDVLPVAEHRTAAERARDSGQAVATGPRQSADTAQQYSRFTLYLPVYRNGMPHHTPALRRQAFVGLVGAEFNAAAFMQPLVARDALRNIRIVIRDLSPSGREGQRENLVYDSASDAPASAFRDDGHPYSETTSLDMGGRNWNVTFEVAARRGTSAQTALPLVLLAGGIVASLLLFGLAWSLSTSRDRAMALATRMTEGLRDSQARARVIGQMLPIPMLTARMEDGAIITMNRRAVELFGISAEAAVGRPISDFCEDPDKCKRIIARLRRDESVRDVELRLKSAAASPIWVMLSASIIQHQGERALLVALVDLSDRKRAEMALRNSEEEFRLIAETSGDMIAVVDTNGGRLYNNPAYARILGDPTDLEGTDSLQDIHPEDRERIRRLLVDTVATGQGHRAQYRILLRNGHIFHIESQGNAIRDENGKVSRIVVISRDITEHKLAEEKIRHLAHHDALTGLPNRVLLRDRLEQAIAQAQRNRALMGLMLLDLDHFKNINDTLGHEAGDDALQAVAERLRTSVRRVDTVARLGGDEFVVVLPALRGALDAEQVARKIIESMTEPLTIRGETHVVSVSIGLSICPTDGSEATVLMKRADLAMYRAKQNGRNQYVQFSEKLDSEGKSIASDE